MDAQLRRGMLEACVLVSLLPGESYGYRLVRDVGEILPMTESTLYPILKRLEASGSVTVRSAEHNGRLRKYYAITDAGIERLKAFRREWQELANVLRLIGTHMEEHGL